MTTNESYMDSLLKARADREFQPFAIFSPEGDCLEFFFDNDIYRADRIDGWVSVYYSDVAPDKIVGGLLKGVRRIRESWPGMEIEIRDGRMRLALILRGPAWEQGDSVKRRVYEKVIQRAEESNIEADLQYV